MAPFALLLLLLHTLMLPAPIITDTSCFTSVFSFGDSLTDTGNRLISQGGDSRYGRSPYGETFFHRPTGRASDSRLIVDFISEAMELPLLPPFFAGADGGDFRRGVNFAVAGATAMGSEFFREKELEVRSTNISLGVQLEFFKRLLPSLCRSDSDCKQLLNHSLILMGSIGGNDYNHAFLQGRKLEEIKSYRPHIVRAISTAITELVGLGARTFLVPGILPNGCIPIFLTLFQSSKAEDCSSTTCCIEWLNQFAECHNDALNKELLHLRLRHPDTAIIYGDYYGAFLTLINGTGNKTSLGRHALAACCGNGGPYNFDIHAMCGTKKMNTCDDPSSYLIWDGIHMTEAAYMKMAEGLLHGPFAVPPISHACSFNQLTVENSAY